MLSPSEYEHLCDQLITLYDDLDNAIINDMVKRMMKTGKVTEATAWQAKQLQQSGMLYEDILEEIAKRTNATRNQVRTLFEDAGVQSIRNDNRSYKAAGLETIVKMSDAALQTLNAGYKKCMGDLSNLTLTTANTSQTAYIKACNLAYMEVTNGTMDYGTAIRRAVQSAADEGSWILYPSGHRDRLDVAVRRSVLTGVGQTMRKISEINANDMDCDIMEITAHAGARPSHAEWQGQFASLSGKNAGRKIDGARVYSLKEIGYGTGDGFGGWNCRHDWFPFFEGISSRAYSNQRLKDLNARNIEYNGRMYSEYEIDQMQRALERKVRERKRAVSAADTAVKNAPDDQTANQMKAFFTEQSVKLKQAEKNLSDFINATGNLPDGTRTWVNGFGRSTAQKAVWANRKAQPQPHMAAILKNNSKGSGDSGNSSNKPKNSQKTLDNSQNNGIIKLRDNDSIDKPVTQQSIENVQYLEVFEPDVNDDMLIDEAARAYEEAEQKNIRYQEACRDLLREVMSHPELEVGTEFSIRYDENMNFVNGEEYRQGEKRCVKIADLGVPFHAFHNHGSDGTLSLGDIFTFIRIENMKSISAVGNSGSLYVMCKTENANRDEYMQYLLDKAKETFFQIGDTKISYLLTTDEEKWNPIKNKLTKSQLNDVMNAMSEFSMECAESGEKYGYIFKYSNS